MSSNGYQPPSLESVLRNLASCLPQNQANPQNRANPQNQTYQQSYTYQQPGSAYPPNQGPPQNQQPWQQHGQNFPVPVSSSTAGTDMPKAIKVIDPATIIDWPSGLRCVMKTVAARDDILDEIRKMIKTHREHEEQWWNSRQGFIAKQEEGKISQKKLNETLRALGAKITVPDEEASDPVKLANDLKAFDMKIYRAQKQMTIEMSTRLKRCGIPFFGTKEELIRKAPKGVDIKREQSSKETTMIDEADLIALQQKMITLLEELVQ